MNEHPIVKNFKVVGKFSEIAHKTTIDGHNGVAVWTDGVMLSINNSRKQPILTTINLLDAAFQLNHGEEYRVTVEAVSVNLNPSPLSKDTKIGTKIRNKHTKEVMMVTGHHQGVPIATKIIAVNHLNNWEVVN